MTPRLRGWDTTYRWPIVVVVALAYAAIVIGTTMRHEVWRDEVVALTIARDAASLADLHRALADAGQPMLWHVCLHYAYLALGSTVALKVVHVAIAIAAILLVLVCSPLPLWLGVLFSFGYLPLYEYAVVSRNHGLGMLCLFAFCALYPRWRDHPALVALPLAALANADILGFVIAVAAGLSLALEQVMSGGLRRPPSARVLLAVSIFGAGLGLSLSGWAHVGLGVIRPDVGARTLVAGVVRAIALPAGHTGNSPSLFPWPPLVTSLLCWLYFVTLLRRPAVLCFTAASLIGLECFFNVAWPWPAARHLGSMLLVVMASVWLDRSEPARRLPWLSDRIVRALAWPYGALAAALVLTLGWNVALAVSHVEGDWNGDYSSSRRLAELIGRSPDLRDAVVVGDPFTMVEALPYYRDNRIYMPREKAFRKWTPARTAVRSSSLADLLDAVMELRRREAAPVIVVLAWDIDGPAEQTMYRDTFLEQTFAVDPEARDEFLRHAKRIARLRSAVYTDENYDVFVVR
jgi:hypothetical protein